jgi:hypothetical protein
MNGGGSSRVEVGVAVLTLLLGIIGSAIYVTHSYDTENHDSELRMTSALAKAEKESIAAVAAQSAKFGADIASNTNRTGILETRVGINEGVGERRYEELLQRLDSVQKAEQELTIAVKIISQEMDDNERRLEDNQKRAHK